jgi:hypothetical protein
MDKTELEKLKSLSPELKNILADENGNGRPDIADNPFLAFGKLKDLMSISGKMNPLLQKYIQSQAAKYNIKVPEGTFANADDVTVNTSEEITAVPVDVKMGGRSMLDAESSRRTAEAGGAIMSGSSLQRGGVSIQRLGAAPGSTANMNAYLNANGVKTVQSGAGRNFLFVLGLLGFIGLLVWQFGGPAFRESVMNFFT